MKPSAPASREQLMRFSLVPVEHLPLSCFATCLFTSAQLIWGDMGWGGGGGGGIGGGCVVPLQLTKSSCFAMPGRRLWAVKFLDYETLGDLHLCPAQERKLSKRGNCPAGSASAPHQAATCPLLTSSLLVTMLLPPLGKGNEVTSPLTHSHEHMYTRTHIHIRTH